MENNIWLDIVLTLTVASGVLNWLIMIVNTKFFKEKEEQINFLLDEVSFLLNENKILSDKIAKLETNNYAFAFEEENLSTSKIIVNYGVDTTYLNDINPVYQQCNNCEGKCKCTESQ